ncbi:MAG: tetratricopeptide repeat protein [Acidobacteriota bacterium]|nr:tetratricopeptide repeat protein [Acidobacteriota bacterium]
MNPRILGLCIVAMLSALGVLVGEDSFADTAEPVRAVLVQATGNVSVEDGGGARHAPRFRRVARLSMVSVGDRIHVGDESRAVLICSNDRRVSLSAGSRDRISVDLCLAGREARAGTFADLVEIEGRVLADRGAVIVERLPRGEGNLREIPRLLIPRNSAVISSQPDLVWTRVPGAATYLLRARGGVSWQQEVPSDHCTPATSSCTLSWPSSVLLPPQTEVEIEVSILDDGGLQRTESVTPRLHRLSNEEALRIQGAIQAISLLDLAHEEQALLSGEIYRAHQLYGEAISALRQATAGSDSSELHLLLGESHLLVGLLDFAEKAFLQALSIERAPEVIARAALGLGQIEWVRGEERVGREHLLEAAALFHQMDRLEEEQAVRRLIGQISF